VFICFFVFWGGAVNVGHRVLPHENTLQLFNSLQLRCVGRMRLRVLTEIEEHNTLVEHMHDISTRPVGLYPVL
jgi:hypothetical protein